MGLVMTDLGTILSTAKLKVLAKSSLTLCSEKAEETLADKESAMVTDAFAHGTTGIV